VLHSPPSAQPLQGQTVVLVHPAWHSCGSHQVFVTQARAYRALGARLIAVAVSTLPGTASGRRAARAYLDRTADLEADARHYIGMPIGDVLTGKFLRAAAGWLHGNEAGLFVEMAAHAPVPAALAELPQIDLVHCNHFFTMPVAQAICSRRKIPILLDSHDVQARQFALRNATRWSLPPTATFETMLALELDCMRGADVLIHLNDEEAATFRGLLPEARHELVYPTINPVAAPQDGKEMIIVASANMANFLGIQWFLKEVLPLCHDIPLRIIGNIDQLFRFRAPMLFKRHAALFAGRIDDLDAAYRQAAAILLPTTEGHGISIKTIEALSSGAPLVATPLAFRGMGIDAQTLGNVMLASDAAAFAAALNRVVKLPHSPATSASPTRQVYDRLFSFAAYCASLAKLLTHYGQSGAGAPSTASAGRTI
jgi:glycosyltransferase involved in cell wall biosynthesis